jgi:guanylate kinase
MVELKLNRTHQLLVCADDVSLLGTNIGTTKKATETLIDASKEVSLEINVEMLLSRHQKAGQDCDIRVANRSFENVSQFRYLRTTVTNQNLIQEEIEREMNSDNACYHSVQNLSSSHLLFRYVEIRIYEIIILLVVLYRCQTLSLASKENID